MAAPGQYDAIVVVSFGGPEGPADVEPFLDNVLRGRQVTPERRAAVAAHYLHFGGRSPINGHTRALVDALREELATHRPDPAVPDPAVPDPAVPDLAVQDLAVPDPAVQDLAVPDLAVPDLAVPDLAVYWGNRNWHPFLADTVRQMRDDGVQRALAFVTSPYASYSGCHQYLEDIARARDVVGAGAPVIDKLRVFYNHPGFVEANAANVRTAWDSIGGRSARVAFTAHSIPVAMAATSDYQAQLLETARLVMARVDPAGALPWSLVFQSRSGPPRVEWLEPDILDHLRTLAAAGSDPVVVAPIGFVADHMEVVYDLDWEAQKLADELGLTMVRAATVGVDARFVAMIRQLIEERLDRSVPRLAIGREGPYHDTCRPDCCPAPPRPARAGPPPPARAGG